MVSKCWNQGLTLNKKLFKPKCQNEKKIIQNLSQNQNVNFFIQNRSQNQSGNIWILSSNQIE